MTMAPDKSQYRINEKHTSIPKYIQEHVTVMWLCLRFSLYLCLPNSLHSIPFHSRPCFTSKRLCCRCKLHIYIFKIGMIQSKSSWFAWAGNNALALVPLVPPFANVSFLFLFLKKKNFDISVWCLYKTLTLRWRVQLPFSSYIISLRAAAATTITTTKIDSKEIVQNWFSS